MRGEAGRAVEISSRDWFGKLSAALILGFGVTLALTCIFSMLFASGDPYFSAQGQIAMWLMAPIWCALLGFCFLFRSAARAWTWLGLANLAAWALYAFLRILLA